MHPPSLSQQERGLAILAPLLHAFANIIGNNGMASPEHASNPKQEEVNFEGFTAAQWAEWGKVKSKIATSTCRLNGELKMRISSLEGEVTAFKNKLVGLSTGWIPDPWEQYDPWSGPGKCTTEFDVIDLPSMCGAE